MIINPIIPIWLMIVVCAIFILLIVLRSKSMYSIIRRIIIISLLFIINVRFMFPSDNIQVTTSNLNVLFVIDTTLSMLAEDGRRGNTRFSGMQSDALAIVEELEGANFSIITFDNHSRTLIPFTRDMRLVRETINTISIVDQMGAVGTAFDVPVNNMLEAVRRSNNMGNRKTIIFLMTDGEYTIDGVIQSFREISRYIDGGAVLGYGTPGGRTYVVLGRGDAIYYGPYKRKELVKSYSL